MKIKKCDICKKTIKDNDKDIMVYLTDRNFSSFEFCSKCAEPVVKFLKSKKLIREEK